MSAFAVERTPRSKTADAWCVRRRTKTWPLRQPRYCCTCWIDKDPVLHYAPFSPHYVGLTPPRTSAKGDREPPPSLGSRLSAELASSRAVVRTKSTSVDDPLATRFPVFMGYCGVHSAEFGPVWAGDLGRSGAAAPTPLASWRPDL